MRTIKCVFFSALLFIWVILSACSQNEDHQSKSAMPVPEVKQTAEQRLAKLIAEAEAGNADSQLELSQRFEDGKGVAKDPNKALELLEKSAQLGNPQAQVKLGNLYRWGEGVKEDKKKAFDLLYKAASQGDAHAQYEIGSAYLIGKSAGPHFSFPVSIDYKKAYEWLKKSAEQGFPAGQDMFALLYANGFGVPKDESRAFEWRLKAASQGHWPAQTSVGYGYERGHGTNKDPVLAYAWYNIAAAKLGSETNGAEANERPPLGPKWNRDRLERQLSPAQLSEGQRLASNWKQGEIILREGGESYGSSADGNPQKKGTGSGVFVSKNGFALTNFHVVKDCGDIRVAGQDNSAQIISSDIANDISLLKLSITPSDYAILPPEDYKLKQGDDVIVFGFPLNSVLSSSGNITLGVVSALAGIKNNASQIQITAAIQPGSSGSPVLNNKGHLVGLIASKLSDVAIARTTGVLPQNINFAINVQTIRSFLESNNVSYRSRSSFFSMKKSNSDIAELAKKWTIIVECWSRSPSESSATTSERFNKK